MLKNIILAMCLVFLGACAANQSKDNQVSHSYCKDVTIKEEIIQCHRQFIFTKIKANWRMATNGLTDSDYPNYYRIKTLISIDESGTIQDLKLVQGSTSHKLNRSVVRGILRSDPLPVPPEPYFSEGNFASIKYHFFDIDVPPALESVKYNNDNYLSAMVASAYWHPIERY